MPAYGKYRGKVVDNQDPEQLGRIVAIVPAVSEMPLEWALPNFQPRASDERKYVVPAVGMNVWIEFEGGDANYPIWTGVFPGSGHEFRISESTP